MITIAPKNDVPEKVERLAVSAAEAARMLGISERTLWQWTKEKRIPSVKIRRRVLYSVHALQKLVNGNKAGDGD